MGQYKYDSDTKASNTFGLVVLAAVAGAVTALLFAPKRGTEVRQDLKDRYNGAKNKTQQSVETARQKAHDTADSAAATVSKAADKVKGSTNEAADKAKDAADTAAATADAKVEEASSRAGRTPRS